jgi:hypothetical protein
VGHASCRNVLVDPMENGDKPMALTGEKKVGYEISHAGK